MALKCKRENFITTHCFFGIKIGKILQLITIQ